MRRRCAWPWRSASQRSSRWHVTFGIPGRLAAVPATVLGASEVIPLELVRAYLPLANGGVRHQNLSAVTAVYETNGTRFDLEKSDAIQVVSPARSDVMT